MAPLSFVLLSFLASAAAASAVPAVEPNDLGAVSSLDTRAISAAKYRIDSNNEVDFNYTTGKPSKWDASTEYYIFVPELYSPAKDDGCQPLHQEIIDLSRHVTLVREGGCNYEIKVKHILERYGKYIMVYGDENEDLDLSETGIDAVGKVSASLGKSWVDISRSGHSVRVAMPQGK